MHRTSTHGHATPALPHSAVHARRTARAWAASASALLVGGLVVAPPAQATQAAQAAQATQTTQAAEEPGGASFTINNVASIFTDSVVNDSPTERTYPFIDPSDEPGVWDYNFRRLVYYGTVEDTRNQVDRYAYMETYKPNMWSRDGWVKPLDQWGPWPGGSLQDGSGWKRAQWLESSLASQGYWSYTTRSLPWGENPAENGVIFYNNETTLQGKIAPWKQTAVGFQPATPGTVAAGQPFLLGTLRNNNLPIFNNLERGTGRNQKTLTDVGPQRFFHGDLNLRIQGDGFAMQGAIPWDLEESQDDTETTVVPRAGGAYTVVANSVCDTNPDGSVAANGSRRKIGGKFTGPARLYNPDGRNSDQWLTGRTVCAQHVGAGNGSYDLYNKGQKGHINQTAGWAKAQRAENDWPDAVDISLRTPASNDTLSISSSTLPDTVWEKDGIRYRMTIWGFTDNGRSASCPAAPPQGAQPVTSMSTPERNMSFACLYASITQERYVRIHKVTEMDGAGAGATQPSVAFTSTATSDASDAPAGAMASSTTPDGTAVSGWVEDGAFNQTLTPSGLGESKRASMASYRAFLVGHSDFTITEADVTPADPSEEWTLESISCVNGAGEAVAATVDTDTKSVNFAGVGAAASAAALTIDCTFTNRARRADVSVKQELVTSGGNGPVTFDVDYKVTATNSGSLDGDTGALQVAPGFPSSLTINSVRVAATQEGLGAGTELAAAGGRYQITSGDPLPANSSREYWVRVNVTRSEAANVDESRFSCRYLGPPRSGYGLYSEVIAAANRDSDGTDNNKACAPVRVRTVVIAKAGRQFTNLQWPEIANEYVDAQGYSYYPLSGSEFAIYDVDPRVDGSATPVLTLDASNTGTFPYYWKVTTLATDKKYWLVETKAPEGHLLLPQPIGFTLSAQLGDGTGTNVMPDTEIFDQNKWTKASVQVYNSGYNDLTLDVQGMIIDGKFTATIMVADREAPTLPYSGGPGLYPYLAASAALIASALAARRVARRRVAS
ncbi:prealbumin-like fold domain-containing protein [uncultured Actinomyces sp.]|uniref:prealbumin-like fold domain-containing protein n=1 Tax=uncultured Actinomyces sp. TaxID=249061 RepID=UPI0028E9E094|nr:prealbumin-like fold domain-containing protein [uncultured Actinomyces sp.]